MKAQGMTEAQIIPELPRLAARREQVARRDRLDEWLIRRRKKDCEGAQKDPRRYAAEGVHAWRIVGFAAVAQRASDSLKDGSDL
jgi:hypothetical protein